MSKTITIDEDAYALLSQLKRGNKDSFTKVILRHIYRPADTCQELLELLEQSDPPQVDEAILKKILAGRGRRSPRKK